MSDPLSVSRGNLHGTVTLGAQADPATAIDLRTRVRNAVLPYFPSCKDRPLPELAGFRAFRRGLQALPLTDMGGHDVRSQAGGSIAAGNRKLVYEYVAGFDARGEGRAGYDTLLKQALALARAGQLSKDEAHAAATATGMAQADRARVDTMNAALDTALSTVGFIKTSFEAAFIEAMLFGEEQSDADAENASGPGW